jgi:oligopeptide transport system substrate-binding protein
MQRLGLVLLCCVLAGGIGCAKTRDAGDAVGKAGTASDNILLFNNLSEPEYLDPGFAQGDVEHNVVNALFEGLVEYDPKDLHSVPGMATTWNVSKDGKRYTFHLRKNAQWSDGRPVTAHDFVYAWTRVLDPKTAAPYAYILYYLKNGQAFNAGKITDVAQVGVRAKDDYTLEVDLENPTPFFVTLTAFHTYRPVPRWVVEKYGPKWTLPAHIVSNGAFMLKSWTPYKEVFVVKNPRYWDAKRVQLAGAKFLPIEEKETGLKMYEAGQLHIAWKPPDIRVPDLMQRADALVGPKLASYFYRLNVTKPPLDDVRVRQALNYAVDRKTIAQKYLQGAQIASAGFVPVGMKGYAQPKGLEFAPAKARALLAEAGYPDPETFPKITIHYNTDERHKLIAQVVQQMWKKHLGINVALLNEEWKSYLKTQNLQQYQVSRSGWIGDYLDPDTFIALFTSTSTMSNTGWKNTEYDAFVAASALERDQAKRFAILAQAEAVLLREAPIIPLFTYKEIMLVKPEVKGIYSNLMDTHPLNHVFIDNGAAVAKGE